MTTTTLLSSNFFSSTRSGRVALHLLCALRRPGHAAWHWQGILREFNTHAARVGNQ